MSPPASRGVFPPPAVALWENAEYVEEAGMVSPAWAGQRKGLPGGRRAPAVASPLCPAAFGLLVCDSIEHIPLLVEDGGWLLTCVRPLWSRPSAPRCPTPPPTRAPPAAG